MFNIGKMCIAFNVSRSGLYAWLDSGLSFKGNENQKLTGQILKAYAESKGTKFLKKLKAECAYQNKFETKQQAALLVFEYMKSGTTVKNYILPWDIYPHMILKEN